MSTEESKHTEETGGGGQLGISRTNQRWIEASPERGQRAPSGVTTLPEGSEVTTGNVRPRKGILVVDVVPRINKRIVICRLIGEGGEVRELIAVRVRDNKNYMVGMEIWDAYEEAPGIWVHPGKGPRRRGVW